ncbi:MAG: hypothetical protein LAP61_28285 [Acidobacteriia bacterium]|nr:hypothetical protein [Terriglobia bacterium]
MARKRWVRPDEVENTFRTLGEHYVQALLRNSTRRAISQRIQGLKGEVQYWSELLDFLTRTPKKEIREQFRHTPTAFAAWGRKLNPLTDEQLATLRVRTEEAILDISGRHTPKNQISRDRTIDLLSAWSRKRAPKIPTIKKEYLDAFRERQEAAARKEAITGKELAQRFIPDRYKTNPESAIRGMLQALQRIATEHRRLARLGIHWPP